MADNLLRLRFLNGGSQEEVAKKVGISRSTLSDAESGLRNPSLGLVVQLATFYKVPLDELLLDPFKVKRLIFGKGYVINGELSAQIKAWQALSHSGRLKVRSFQIPEEKMIRLKAIEADSLLFVMCQEGLLQISGKGYSIDVKAGQFVEVNPACDKKIWSCDGVSKVLIIQCRKD